MDLLQTKQETIRSTKVTRKHKRALNTIQIFNSKIAVTSKLLYNTYQSDHFQMDLLKR